MSLHTLSSPVTTVYYVASNPNKVVSDLTVDSPLPLYKFCDLSWTEPPQPGRYYVYWEINGEWVDSGISTLGNSLQISPPNSVTRIQLRTDNLYPSNVVSITFHTTPRVRTLNIDSRYDGVFLGWDPLTASDERVEIRRSNTLVFFDNTQSYFDPNAGTYKIRMVKGSGSDLIYGPWSNSVTGSLLPAPPDRVEPTAPCDFFLGVNRAGEQIFHMCNPAVVPETPPAVESGKTATDWFQDWVGVNVDYGVDTYFHSMFKYLYCTQAVRLRDYSDVQYPGSGTVRRFNFTNAESIETGETTTFTLNQGRMLMVVEVDNFGNRKLASPALVRELDITDTEMAVDVLYFGSSTGFGTASAYYGPTTSFLRSNRSVRYLEMYELNIAADGLDLQYIDITGADNGIKLDENTFEVAGNDFTNMMISYCGTVNDGSYVNSMNLSDAIISDRGSVDPLGIYHGPSPADAIQVLGSSGGSGWDVTMETGVIKRGGKTWFNAGRGRNRIKFEGIVGSDSTNAFTIVVPTHSIIDADLNLSLFSASGVVTSETVLIPPTAASMLGYSIVPTASGGNSDWTQTEIAQKPVLGFSSFENRVLIHTYIKDAKFNKSLQPSGDPWWETWYSFKIRVYLRRVTNAQFVFEYDIDYTAAFGSGGKERSITIPAFSLSFIGLS
jgi:hypothetical protein